MSRDVDAACSAFLLLFVHPTGTLLKDKYLKVYFVTQFSTKYI